MRRQRGVLFAPGEEAPVKGVLCAGHARLVAVVDRRDPGQSVVDGGGKQQQLFCPRQLRRGMAELRLRLPRHARAICAAEHGQDPLGIVGAQQVHAGVHRLRRVVQHHAVDLVHELRRVAGQGKMQHGVPEGVVHHAVQLPSVKVAPPSAVADLVAGVLPDLAQQQFVSAVALDRCAHRVQKRVRQLVGDVQPEAVRAHVHPAVDHAALAGDESGKGGVVLVDLRQGVDVPPAGVAAVLPEVVPAVVRGILALPRADVRVAARCGEIAAVVAGVAEHAVQQDLDPKLMRLAAQGGKVGVRPQQRVHVQVVRRVVTVVGMGLKDGVQIDGIHAQRRDVGQLLRDPAQVAAVVIVVGDPAGLVRQVDRQLTFVPVEDPVPGHARLRRAGIAEAVRENLVDDPALEAVGRAKRRVVNRQLPLFGAVHACGPRAGVLAQHGHAPGGLIFKIVEVKPPGQPQLRRPPFVIAVGALPVHRDIARPLAVFVQRQRAAVHAEGPRQ